MDPALSLSGMETFIQAADLLPDVFDLSFTIAAGGGQAATAGFLVSGFSPDHAAAMCLRLKVLAEAAMPYLGLGSEVEVPPLCIGASCLTLERLDETGHNRHHLGGGAWRAAARGATRTTMTLTLNGFSTSRVQEGDDVRCDIEIQGESGEASLVAALLAADAPLAGRLVPRPHTGRSLRLPLTTVAHLMSVTCRLQGMWPAESKKGAAELVGAFDGVIPPHGVVFGGSGQGKTTFIEHRVRAAVTAGRAVLVMCPTGDMAARAASILQQAGRPFDAVDFGDSECPARFNLCEPPSWVAPEEHVSDVVDAIEQAWLGELSTMMFGPVGRRSMRGAVSVLVRDPAGPWPITLAPELLRGGQLPDFWRDALDRIGDRDLEILMLETARAISNDKDAHYAPWLQSKLEPLIGSSRIRRVVDCDRGTIRLERLVEGRSLVISAPSATLGDVGATVLMGALLSQVWHLLRSVDISRRPDLDLVVDEVQRLHPALLSTLLAEGRKYGVRLLLATQSVASLQPKLVGSMLANCGAIGTFKTGMADAATLDPKFPTVLASRLQRLGRHEMAVTTGDWDAVGVTPPPLVDHRDSTALSVAHRRALQQPDAVGKVPQ